MSEEVNTQQQTQQDPTPGAKGGRTFTQDDVNRIVSERLAHEREKLQASARDTEREKALAAREARLDCREYLDTKGSRQRSWTCWTALTRTNSRTPWKSW